MSTIPEISVVVPTYNNSKAIPELIGALAAQTLDPHRWDLTLVDDCSTDGSWNTILSLVDSGPAPFRALQTKINSGGPAAPRNLGWQSSSGRIVAFLDDDCLPEPGWLAAGLQRMQADQQIGVMQGCTRTPPEIDLTHLDRSYVYRLITEPSPWFQGTNIFYRRAALEQVAGFDEDIAWWGEDTDLGWKVIEAGWERGFAADAVAIHDVERRDWRWWVRFSWLDRNLVKLAADHPRLREEAFWRPWAMRREDVAFPVAVIAAVASLKWRPAAVLALPYLWWKRPSVRAGRVIGQGVEIVLGDFARFAGHLSGSITNRVFVL